MYSRRSSTSRITLILVTGSGISMYGHWCYTMRYINDITKIAESVCTALQTIVALLKLLFFLFMQRNLYKLLDQAQTHQIIMDIEIFRKEFSMMTKLKRSIDGIMERNWSNIRKQLIFYICSCVAISCNYYFSALIPNIYHAIKKTPGYKHVLPFPSVYPMWESRGMAFPYYAIQMFLCGCSVYIAAMCAVGFDGVFIVLCVHAIALIQVLNTMIKESTSCEIPKESRVEYLRNCIFLYQHIYDFVLNVSVVYKHICLSQFLLSLIIWGIVLFQMSVGLESNKTTTIRMILYLIASGYGIVSYCFNSQRLTNEYEKIPITLYNCNWYNESQDFKQLVQMMILRTNRTFYLKISWFATMTLATFLAMVQTSGSYFLLLRNLAE